MLLNKMSSEFYITLPSNIISKEEGNSLSRWKTILPNYVVLDSVYEVGVAEISFTNSWYNVLEDQIVGLLEIPVLPGIPDLEEVVRDGARIAAKSQFDRRLKADRYPTIDSLLTSINSKLDEYDIEWHDRPAITKEEGTNFVNCLRVCLEKG